MKVEERLAEKRSLIEQLAANFVRKHGWLEYDDAVQIVSEAAWRVIKDGKNLHDGLIAWYAWRRLVDELRTGRQSGVSRRAFARGDRTPIRLAFEDDLASRQDASRELDPYERINDDQAPTIARALGSLAERDRFVVYLRYWEDMSERAIGEVIGVSESRVSQILTRARKKMRPLLAA